MGRREVFQTQYEQKSRRVGIPAGGTAGGAAPSRRMRRGGSKRRGVLIAIAILVLLAGWMLIRNEGRPPVLSIDGLSVELAGTGTGFFISGDGWFVTAAHVVEGAEYVKVLVRDELLPARMVRMDIANDVALLKVEGVFPALMIGKSEDLSLGDGVFTIGFPMPDLQGQSPKLTRGDISSLAGLQDDPRHFQISIPVQPGNSGGPLCSADGIVRGVIVSRIDDRVVMKSSGLVPQNINYALKSSYLLALLSPEPGEKALRVAPQSAPMTAAQRVEAATAMVVSFLERR